MTHSSIPIFLSSRAFVGALTMTLLITDEDKQKMRDYRHTRLPRGDTMIDTETARWREKTSLDMIRLELVGRFYTEVRDECDRATRMKLSSALDKFLIELLEQVKIEG